MKKKLLLIALALGVSITSSTAQSSKKWVCSSAQRQMYMKNAYNLTTEQALRYEAAVQEKTAKEAAIKNKVISYSKYAEEMAAIRLAFRKVVKTIFDKSQFAVWTQNTRQEWYRFIGEDLLIPVDKVLRIMAANDQYTENINALGAGSLPQQQKREQENELGLQFRRNVTQILGENTAKVFMYEKLVQRAAVSNMNKYKTSYNEGLKIAEAERDFRQLRTEIIKKGLRSDERKEALAANDANKQKAIDASLSENTRKKWKAINDNQLNYSLANDYGLTSTQIAQFKEHYNRYAIADYKIQKAKITIGEKTTKWTEANKEFCNNVKPLFGTEAYNKWYGNRMFDFERGIKGRIDRANKK